MSETGTDTAVFGVRLDRTRDVPVRFAFAALVGSTRGWAWFVVGLPLAALLAAQVHDVFVPFAAAMPFGIALLLLWMSHEFVAPRVTVDYENRTLTKTKPYTDEAYSPIDADDFDHVTILRFTDVALVRFHYTRWAVAKPLSTSVSTAEVPAFESALEQMGVDVAVRDVTVPSPIYARIVATPIVVVGMPLVVWGTYGRSAFLSNAVVVPAVVLVLYGVYGYRWRRRLRRSTAGDVRPN
ncbi:hypothetical protein GJR96_09125 [Haloferax sp. MBLA0076]|uniref:Uncharacterized protein n=1 Tax=Haloferax litoreum TaxID=2666140 RepID=A0A6A8GGV1_9EURY|nr:MULTISPECIES: hypothetical protein [Haloferax]KAB1193598.1 hypothetical protein Hfx1148_09110 [Haloferax sp. CBA1148]MRX22116.1 hypothetical protein [Haloferax litoreum]